MPYRVALGTPTLILVVGTSQHGEIMSLEERMVALTEALDRNTAAILGGKPPAAAGKPAPGKPAPSKPATPTITADEIKLAVNTVARDYGVLEARKIIADVGKAKALADIPEARWPAVLAACQAKMTPPDESALAAEDEAL